MNTMTNWAILFIAMSVLVLSFYWTVRGAQRQKKGGIEQPTPNRFMRPVIFFANALVYVLLALVSDGWMRYAMLFTAAVQIFFAIQERRVARHRG